MTKEAYTKLIEQDLAVLNKHMPDSLELDHIKLVLTSSIDCYYPSEGNQANSENANCAIFDVSGSLLPDEYWISRNAPLNPDATSEDVLIHNWWIGGAKDYRDEILRRLQQ